MSRPQMPHGGHHHHHHHGGAPPQPHHMGHHHMGGHHHHHHHHHAPMGPPMHPHHAAAHHHHQHMPPTAKPPTGPAPPLALLRFASEQALIKREKLTALRSLKGNVVLGIDGNRVLETLHQTAQEQEKFWALSSAFPYSPFVQLAEFVENCKRANIKPVFVFNGMQLAKQFANDPPFPRNLQVLGLVDGSERSAPRFLDSQAARDLEMNVCAGATLDDDGEGYLCAYLKSNPGVEVYRAPYWAWSQLSAFFASTNRYVSEVYGCPEMLAFRGVERVILNIDFVNGTFDYLSKTDVVQRMKQTPGYESFDETMLSHLIAAEARHRLFNDGLATPMVNQTLPQMFDSVRSTPSKTVLEMLRSVYNHVQVDRFRRCVAAIEDCPVLTARGECVSLCTLYNKNPHAGLKDIFGAPLPPVYYYALFTGLIGPQVLYTVASRAIVDVGPMVDTKEYRHSAEFVVPLRTQIVYQLVQAIAVPENTNFASGNYDITWVRRYNPSVKTQASIPILQPPQIKLDEWDIPEVMEQEPPVYFHDVLKWAAKARTDYQYRTRYQVVAAIHLKALDLLGYFTHATQSNSTEVSGPSIYTTALGYCMQRELSEYGVLLIELLRTKTLTDIPLSIIGVQYSNELATGPGVIFASRLLSMLPIRLKSPWSGPISAPLVAYNAMVRSLHRTLRALTEVIGVVMLLQGTAQCGLEQTLGLELDLPFQLPPNAYAGIIISYMLNNPEEKSTLANLQRVFPDCEDLAADLEQIFCFWYYTFDMLYVLAEDDPQTMDHAYQLVVSVSPMLQARARMAGSQIVFQAGGLVEGR